METIVAGMGGDGDKYPSPCSYLSYTVSSDKRKQQVVQNHSSGRLQLWDTT